MKKVTRFFKRAYELFSFRRQLDRVYPLSNARLLLGIFGFPIMIVVLGISLSFACGVVLIGRGCGAISDRINGYY